MLATASAVLAGSDPRFDVINRVHSQEWPQDSQNEYSTRNYTADFIRVTYPGIVPNSILNPASWQETLGTIQTGEVVTDYMSGLGAPVAPYGLMAIYTNKQVQIRSIQNPNYLLHYWNIPCEPVGSFSMIGDVNTVTVLNLDNCGNIVKRSAADVSIKNSSAIDLSCKPIPCVISSSTTLIGSQSFDEKDWREAGKGHIYFNQKVSGDEMYFTVDMRTEKKVGLIEAWNWKTMSKKWKVPLEAGNGEFYEATTPVTIRGTLVVVGAVKMRKDKDYKEETDPLESALFGFDIVDGSKKWVFKITKAGKINPTPARLEDRIIFGTSRGRFFAVGLDGIALWQTNESGRVRTIPLPYNAPSVYAEVAMHGPAMDAAGEFAYFSGDDGRVHRVGIRSGSIFSSDPLGYYLDPDTEHAYRTFTIASPPAIAQNSDGDSNPSNFLVVVATTRYRNPDSTGSVNLSPHPPAALMVLSIPGLRLFSNELANFASMSFLNPDSSNIFDAGTLRSYGGLIISGDLTRYFDPVNNIVYFDPHLSSVTAPFAQFKVASTGPVTVSISNGFVLSTCGFVDEDISPEPNDFVYGRVVATGSYYYRGFTSPSLLVDPRALNPASAMDPVQVYPNPFRPDQAFGGTAKFNNLPRGSRVELYTLAYERVRLLRESGFKAEWDGRNESGQEVAPGVYHYLITIPDRPAMRGKLVVVRK